MENICLDTDIVINFLRGKPEEVAFIAQNEFNHKLAITIISLFELYHEAYKSGKEMNIQQVHELARRFVILRVSPQAAEYGGRLLAELEKDGTPIDMRDLLIGSIAKVEGFKMKTKNMKHFKRIEGLNLSD